MLIILHPLPGGPQGTDSGRQHPQTFALQVAAHTDYFTSFNNSGTNADGSHKPFLHECCQAWGNLNDREMQMAKGEKDQRIVGCCSGHPYVTTKLVYYIHHLLCSCLLIAHSWYNSREFLSNDPALLLIALSVMAWVTQSAWQYMVVASVARMLSPVLYSRLKRETPARIAYLQYKTWLANLKTWTWRRVKTLLAGCCTFWRGKQFSQWLHSLFRT